MTDSSSRHGARRSLTTSLSAEARDRRRLRSPRSMHSSRPGGRYRADRHVVVGWQPARWIARRFRRQRVMPKGRRRHDVAGQAPDKSLRCRHQAWPVCHPAARTALESSVATCRKGRQGRSDKRRGQMPGAAGVVEVGQGIVGVCLPGHENFPANTCSQPAATESYSPHWRKRASQMPMDLFETSAYEYCVGKSRCRTFPPVRVCRSRNRQRSRVGAATRLRCLSKQCRVRFRTGSSANDDAEDMAYSFAGLRPAASAGLARPTAQFGDFGESHGLFGEGIVPSARASDRAFTGSRGGAGAPRPRY